MLGEAAYVWTALRQTGQPVKPREARRYPAYIGLKALALLQSPAFIRARDWAPAPHEADR
jgi:hypothetical protein